MCKGDGILLRNLLLNENHPLHNWTLHISGTFKEPEKANIEDVFTAKGTTHIQILREALNSQAAFGRPNVYRGLGLNLTSSSELLSEMAMHGIIEPVNGHGKGKYHFRHQEN